MSSAAAAQVRAVVEDVVLAAGLDLEDVIVRRAGQRSLVQIVVDRDGGVDLDTVAVTARGCSDALDSVELFGGAYDLEVSSPGVDRPLTEPRHWRRNTGRLVAAKLRDGKTVTGRIVASDDDAIVLSVDSSERTIAYADLARGVVQVEFKRPAGADSGKDFDDTDDTDDIDDVGDTDHDEDDEEAAR
jgi:ribosome maturation factor RimP